MNKTQITSLHKLSTSLRILSADAIEKANSGHPGFPLGFSDVFTMLVTKYLKYNPTNPTWYGRDRLVLSAGHGSMLLYSFFHLSGYEKYTLNEIKNFRQVGSITPGHPEYDISLGIETTSGPLGQGFANSVGMAIAQKKYLNKLGPIMDYKIYVICGDGCLMEGITQEATSLAGHLRLNNLIVLFDDNNISIDGHTSLTTSDDHQARFEALGWNSLKADGHDFDSIDNAILKAQSSNKPSFIAFKTKIGFGAGRKEGSEESHGAALGGESIKILRENLAWKYPPFEIPDEIYKEWILATEHKQVLYRNWQDKYLKLSQNHKDYLNPPNTLELQDAIAIYGGIAGEAEATRVSSGRMIEIISKSSDKVIIGSADLSISNNVYNSYSRPITKDDFSGNFIHYGIRENAMAAIMNGLATQNFLPIGASFLVFSDYMRPSIRLSSIMKLQVIYIMTHDSIGVGEDGPTHQPIEHLASLRAMPNLNVFRPCDRAEVESCFNFALENKNSPTLIALSRQKLNQQRNSVLKRDGVLKGAYILYSDSEKVDVSIWATGSEVDLALETSRIISKAGFSSRIISCPNVELFLNQSTSYKRDILDLDKKYSKFNALIEAASKFGWERIIGLDGLFFGVDNFGASGPAKDLYSYFHLTPAEIANKIIDRVHKFL